jgi:rRNA maturation RNase YbeY
MVVKDAARLLELIGLEAFELSIMLVDDEAIRALNREHRGKDTATDVLSFPQLEESQLAQLLPPGTPVQHRCASRPDDRRVGTRAGLSARIDNRPPIPLGDIVISLETADRQARALGVSRVSRIRTLLIHGLLHLLGYDHERSRADARRQFACERKLAIRLRGSEQVRRKPVSSRKSP